AGARPIDAGGGDGGTQTHLELRQRDAPRQEPPRALVDAGPGTSQPLDGMIPAAEIALSLEPGVELNAVTDRSRSALGEEEDDGLGTRRLHEFRDGPVDGRIHRTQRVARIVPE